MEQQILYGEPSTLELEKRNFLLACYNFISDLEVNQFATNGRPACDLRDVIKSLLIMSFHGMSYRRAYSDLLSAYEQGIVTKVLKRSTFCAYMNDKHIKEILQELIQRSALPFIEGNDTLIVDSTWFALKMYSGGHNRKPVLMLKEDKASLEKTRKLHIGVLQQSRIIAFAKPTLGTVNDSPLFEEIVSTVANNGFIIRRCLADAGYLSKANYALCQSLGIEQAFIDFKSNITGKRAKSAAWREAFDLYKNHNDVWHETYRYRVTIEFVFSCIKRKYLNYLRTKNEVARDNEMLLKALCYNLTIIGKQVSLQGA